VVGAALVPGRAAPRIINRQLLTLMKKGSVLVDVSIDQGGIAETSRPTTHSDPVYEVEGVIHYCVANMPGAVPRTSTFALTNATVPLALEIANRGVERAAANRALRAGINVYKGYLVSREVAASQGKEWRELPF
jgi:alanine dehydrogenase